MDASLRKWIKQIPPGNNYFFRHQIPCRMVDRDRLGDVCCHLLSGMYFGASRHHVSTCLSADLWLFAFIGRRLQITFSPSSLYTIWTFLVAFRIIMSNGVPLHGLYPSVLLYLQSPRIIFPVRTGLLIYHFYLFPLSIALLYLVPPLTRVYYGMSIARLYSIVFRLAMILLVLDFVLCLIWLPIGASKTYGLRTAREAFLATCMCFAPSRYSLLSWLYMRWSR